MKERPQTCYGPMKANRASVRVSGLMWCAGGAVGGDVGEGAQGGGAWSDRGAAQ